MGKKFKVIIAGSRDFQDYGFLKEKCDKVLEKHSPDIEVVCGMARGADKLGRQYAKEKGYSLKEKPAPWDDIEGKPPGEIREGPYGKYWVKAGYHRNQEMADYADALIAFDMETSGTKDMIKRAKKNGLQMRVYNYQLRF